MSRLSAIAAAVGVGLLLTAQPAMAQFRMLGSSVRSLVTRPWSSRPSQLRRVGTTYSIPGNPCCGNADPT